jgi:uncharacterized protein involved in exopolysaccharide biosynthesis
VSVPSEFIVSAKSSTSTSGKRLRVRLAETFFRRWPLLIVPVLLVSGLGVSKALNLTGKYRSVGTVSVATATFLSELSNVRPDTGGYETPAQQTARSVNEQLSSDTFAQQVAERAGLTTALSQGAITLDDIRRIVWATPQGDTLLAVVATSDNPELSSRLATSLISTYTDFVLARDTSASNASASFYQGQVEKFTSQVNAAQASVDQYISEHPAPAIGARPENETFELNRLNNVLQQAQTNLDEAQGKLDDSTLATETSESDIGQRLQVVDEPQTPLAPESVKRDKAITVAVFFFLGLLVAAALLVIGALMDRTVRTVSDLTGEGLTVLATIQRQGRGVSPLALAPTTVIAASATEPELPPSAGR